MQPINKHWFKLSKFLNYGPSKMQNFKKIIASAHTEMKTDFEDERRKTLELFFKKRTKKRIMEFNDLMSGEDIEAVKVELQAMHL